MGDKIAGAPDPGALPARWGSAEEKQRAFARFYMDASNPLTYQSAIESMKAVSPPGLKRQSLKRMGYRYLELPVVQEEIALIESTTKALVGMGLHEFVELCLARERALHGMAMRGHEDDARYGVAAASYLKMAGIALGVQNTRIEDATPPERKLAGLSTAQMLQISERLKMLSEPNPLPAAQIAAPRPEAIEADFTIIEESPECPPNQTSNSEPESIPSSSFTPGGETSSTTPTTDPASPPSTPDTDRTAPGTPSERRSTRRSSSRSKR